MSHFASKTLLHNETYTYFLKTIELAEQNNITVIFVKYPVTRDYNNLILKNNLNREDYYNTIFKDVNSRIPNYIVLDYYDTYFDNPEYFGDADHLNYVGAEAFTNKLYKDLQPKNSTAKRRAESLRRRVVSSTKSSS